MKLLMGAAVAALLAGLAGQASADVVISNARIIVGDGKVIEHGTVTIQGERIVSVAADAAPAPTPGRRAPKVVVPAGQTRIDGTGLTVMAGFIDAHRHLVGGPAAQFFNGPAQARMKELLEAGFTTVQEGGGDNALSLELKKRVASGEIKGPRILASSRWNISDMKTEAEVRAAVRAAKDSGADSIAEVHYPAKEPPNPPTFVETRNFLAALDESRKVGIPMQIHAVSPASTVEVAVMGGKMLIHTPHFDWLKESEADVIRDAGAQVASCTGFGPPVFDVFNKDNKPTFRDGKPWPQGIVSNEGQGREGGLLPINGRMLFDHGVNYAYCTDTTYNATESLNQELKTLNLAFSIPDIIKIMGPNSARFLGREKDLGTVEAGKLADLVVLGGNPLVGFWNFMTAEVVIKGGEIVLDKRGSPNAGKPMDKPQS